MLSSGIRSTRIQRSVLWLATVFALVSARAQPTEVAGSLPEDYLPPLRAILQKAESQSPQTIEKAIELAQQEARLDIFNSERLPQLRATADYAINETSPSDANAVRTRDSGFFYRVELTQAIFRWGELKNKSALGRLGVLMAEKRYAEAYRALTQSLRQSYMDRVAQKIDLKASRHRHQLEGENFRRAQVEHEGGTMPEKDFRARELDFAEKTLELAAKEEDFAAARRVFARLAGMSELSEESLPDRFPLPSYSPALAKAILAEMLRETGKFTFPAEMSALEVREADLNYQIARVKLLPKFEALGASSVQNLATAGPTAITQTGVAYQTLALRLDWPIFDGFKARGEKRQALLSRELSQRRTEQASEAAVERAQHLERQLGLFARRVEIANTRFVDVETNERQQRDEFAAGRTSQVSIVSARQSLLDQEAHNARLRAQFLTHWSEFISLAGRDPAMNYLPRRYAREKR